MNLLSDELTNDPLTRGYAGMSDAAVAASLNTVNRTVNRETFSGDQAFRATNGDEFAALTSEKKQLWLAFCGRDEIDPFAVSNVDFVTWIVGGASVTVTALGTMRTRDGSRAEELGLNGVTHTDVAIARGRTG